MNLLDLASYVIGDDVRCIKEGPASIIATLVVMIGWYISRRAQIKSERINNTAKYINVLTADNLGKPLIEYGILLRAIINNEKQRDIKYISDVDNLKKILTIIEKTATSVSVGLISESYDNKIAATFYRDSFNAFSWYISHIRNEFKSDTIFMHFEQYVIRSNFRSGRLVSFIAELIYGYPIFSINQTIFKIEYALFRPVYGFEKNYLLEKFENVQRMQRDILYLKLLMAYCIFVVAYVFIANPIFIEYIADIPISSPRIAFPKCSAALEN